jgi:hypothetical protein
VYRTHAGELIEMKIRHLIVDFIADSTYTHENTVLFQRFPVLGASASAAQKLVAFKQADI